MKMIEDMSKNSQLRVAELEAQLQDSRKRLIDDSRFYPATEVRQKAKFFVTVSEKGMTSGSFDL